MAHSARSANPKRRSPRSRQSYRPPEQVAKEAEEEAELDARGWWERPEERSMEAYRPKPLDAWQVQKLESAYCAGRRKIQARPMHSPLTCLLPLCPICPFPLSPAPALRPAP